MSILAQSAEILATSTPSLAGVAKIGMAALAVGGGTISAIKLHTTISDGHCGIVERYGRALAQDATEEDPYPKRFLTPGSYWEIPVRRRIKVISFQDKANVDEGIVAEKHIIEAKQDPDDTDFLKYEYALHYIWGVIKDKNGASAYRSHYRSETPFDLRNNVDQLVHGAFAKTISTLGALAALESVGDPESNFSAEVAQHSRVPMDYYGTELRRFTLYEFARSEGQLIADSLQKS